MATTPMNAALISRKALKIRGTPIATFQARQPLGLSARLGCDPDLSLTLSNQPSSSRLTQALGQLGRRSTLNEKKEHSWTFRKLCRISRQRKIGSSGR